MLEQFFEISVPMSSAVPYAAAVVAGPIVGGALVAAEAVFDNSMTKMTTLHYKVAGSMAKSNRRANEKSDVSVAFVV
jgi:uncharacterized protein YhdP